MSELNNLLLPFTIKNTEIPNRVVIPPMGTALSNPDGTVTYSPEEMEHALSRAGCDRVVQHSMHNIELHRTGTNRFFPNVPDGWIQIAECRL